MTTIEILDCVDIKVTGIAQLPILRFMKLQSKNTSRMPGDVEDDH